MSNNTMDQLMNSTAQPAQSSSCSHTAMFAWKQDYLTPTTFVMFVVAVSLEIVMFPLITLLNGLVILAVKKKRYLRKQKHCVLAASLAVTDLFVGVVVLPLVITANVMRLSGMGPICLMDRIATEATYIACGASMCHLAIISGERYVAIKHALRYETLVTTGRLTTAVAVAWAIPIILTIASVVLEIMGETELWDQLKTLDALISCSSVALAVSYFQIAIYLESRRHRRQIAAHQISQSAAEEFLKNDKAAKSVKMVVGAMWLCYLPSVISFTLIVAVKSLPASMVFGLSYAVAAVFVFFNSLVNPLIYCVRTQDFTKAFRELGFNVESAPPENLELAIRVRPRRQRASSGLACSNLPSLPPPRLSRSRSVDLSKDSTHRQKARRANSV